MDASNEFELRLQLCIRDILRLWGELKILGERIVELRGRVDWHQLLLDGGEYLHLELLIPQGDHENIMGEENDFMDLSDRIDSHGNNKRFGWFFSWIIYMYFFNR